jgi:type VI secretion system protein ImpL
MFAEAGLAGLNRRREIQMAALQIGAYAALLLVAALGVIALAVSFSLNKTYLADVGASLDSMNALALPTSQQSLAEMVPSLDALRGVVDTADRYRGHLAWTMRWGLFQGAAIGDEAREAYQRVLNNSLLPSIADEFRQAISVLEGLSDARRAGASGQIPIGFSREPRLAADVRYPAGHPRVTDHAPA